MTDEAHFHLNSYVNPQNTQIWSDENSHAVHQIIIGPVCHKTLNLDCYVTNILEPFFERLIDGERQYGYFQQDSAAVHAARNSVSVLQ